MYPGIGHRPVDRSFRCELNTRDSPPVIGFEQRKRTAGLQGLHIFGRVGRIQQDLLTVQIKEQITLQVGDIDGDLVALVYLVIVLNIVEVQRNNAEVDQVRYRDTGELGNRYGANTKPAVTAG